MVFHQRRLTHIASIVKAGTYLAESIKTIEAAKIIENTQRDLNIALINELALFLKNGLGYIWCSPSS